MNQRITENTIILVQRRTRLQELIVRYNTIQQAQFYIERLGADFGDYVQEDRMYHQALEQAVAELQPLGRVQRLDREHVPSFIFGPEDIVVVLGQDGLVANTMKYVTNQPLIGVNPDPQRWDGVLLPFTVGDLGKVIPEVFRRQRQVQEVRLARAELNDGQSLTGVNDLFIGRRTHVSARYEIRVGEQQEQQSSSGIIVSTGMGSTGWFKSVMAGAAGIVRQASQQEVQLSSRDSSFAWDAPYLYYSVREPFPSRTTAAELVFGRIDSNQPLRIVSQMPENGVIFSDGVESDYLEFNSGIEATISVAQQKAHLVI
ncbi:diacylglycerol kinase catalytic domain-containing protein [Paenibacillus wulumuqiensis]|uniref:sugar kinase n=1 Tax=Paenibacillus wulumuqiensis TaxID=1567107 RepID=UPI0006198D4B|nr:sugar kinase [Paenibacillus wulumuqiensis]